MLSYDNIRKVHLEISTRCNAACPACPRNLCGVDILDDYPLVDMKLAQAQKIFSESFLQQLDNILINGNYGDFVTARDGVAIVEYFKTANPKLNITISTNASAMPHIWQRLGELSVTVKFRLDGLADTHKLYRQNTNWDAIIANAGNFIKAGGTAIWTMIRFDHNKHQIDQCRQLSKQLGFSDFELIDQGRDTMPVFDKDKKLSHVIGDYRDITDFDEIHNRYVNCDSQFPFKMDMPEKTINCWAKKQKEIYVAANGDVSPCCWLGFYPQHGLAHPSNAQIRSIADKNNALDYDIKTAIEWFGEIEKTWGQTRPIYACYETCGK